MIHSASFSPNIDFLLIQPQLSGFFLAKESFSANIWWVEQPVFNVLMKLEKRQLFNFVLR